MTVTDHTRHQTNGGATQVRAREGQAAKALAGGSQVLAWEDDPNSGNPAIPMQTPNPKAGTLKFKMAGKVPPAKLYNKGTNEFRIWSTSAALRRTADFWTGLLPAGAVWEPGNPLKITIDHGDDLNAYYDRKGLWFFHHMQADGTTVYSGESPDICCHEMGHAILDILRPELWGAPYLEAAAFHESFADMSAILTALQLPQIRKETLAETNGMLYRSSRLSRLAEQLGDAIRAVRPDLVDPDCLRNAVNSFFYQDPQTLPTTAPAAQLSSEPHSFSRVFTAAFYEALSNILSIIAANPTEADLLQASNDAGRLLVDAVSAAPVVPDYYSQIAAHFIEADATRFKGKYRDGLRSAFARHGVLALSSAAAVGSATLAMAPEKLGMAAAAGADRPRRGMTHQLRLAAADFGLGNRTLVIHAPAEMKRFPVAAAAIAAGPALSPSTESAARTFVAGLMRRGRIDTSRIETGDSTIVHPRTHKTHTLTKRNGDLVLERLLFDCGFRVLAH